MTIQQASVQFNVTEAEIAEYVEKGLLSHTDEGFAEQDFRHVGLVRSLLVMGMEEQTIRRYLSLLGRDNSQREQVNLLRKFRAHLLERIHRHQQSLDQIDYLIYHTTH